MSQYLPIVVLALLGVVFGVLSFAVSRLLAPRRPSVAKEAPYECGILPSREAPERFPVSFYVVAMLFIMFDIEIIFVYPYAVSQAALGTYGFVAIVIFSVLSSSRSCTKWLVAASTGAHCSGLADSCPTRPSARSAPRRRRSGASVDGREAPEEAA